MSQWYLHDPASQQRLGPMDLDAARAQAARNPALLAWKEGMGDWLPVRNIAELYDDAPGGVAGAPPPPPRNGGKGRADEIDFKIFGDVFNKSSGEELYRHNILVSRSAFLEVKLPDLFV